MAKLRRLQKFLTTLFGRFKTFFDFKAHRNEFALPGMMSFGVLIKLIRTKHDMCDNDASGILSLPQ